MDEAKFASRHPLQTEVERKCHACDIEPNGVALPTISREDQERWEELLQRWMVALYDGAGMKSVMRFPHVRLAEKPRRNLPSRR